MKTHSLHVGLMVPINNTTMEGELLAWLPAGSRVTTLRIPRGKGLLTPETIPAYSAQALVLAEDFKSMDVDILAYGCTAASFLQGPVADAAFAKQLSKVVDRPVVTTASAMVRTLLAQGVKRIGLVTPYQDLVNDQLKAFLKASNIEVAAFDSLYAPNVDALGLITSDEVAAIAKNTITPACEALFIACSQLPTKAILQSLSDDFGRPVLSSIQVTAHQLMETLNASV
jgi:maleate cis-trans isomerase